MTAIKTKPTRVAIYLRVSTDKQTTENQLPGLEFLCQQRGWEIIKVYEEQASAWDAGHQPELAKLTEQARRAQFDVVLVWALDRLCRQGSYVILQMVDKFKKYGVKVVSVQEPWTEAPGELADILYSIAGWVAQQESKRRSERVRAGLARAKMQGKGVRGPDIGRRKRRWRRRPSVEVEVQESVSAMSAEDMAKYAAIGYRASLEAREKS